VRLVDSAESLNEPQSHIIHSLGSHLIWSAVM
jgi:hypothetical protein